MASLVFRFVKAVSFYKYITACYSSVRIPAKNNLRRNITMFKKVLSLLLIATLLCSMALCFASCNKDDDATGMSESPLPIPELTADFTVPEDFKIGFICLHDESSTYDKNFIDAVLRYQAALGLKDEQVIIKRNIEETEKCYEAAVDLVSQGCDIIFANSFGHEPYVAQAAEAYPDVQFCHATGVTAADKGLDNFHNAFASIYQGRFLAGVAAGMKLLEIYDTDADGVIADAEAKIGYVGAHPYAEVISGYTSFYLGVKYIVPNVTMEVRYTGSWYDETAEKTTAEALIANGCTLISQHADSMGAPTACENANIPNVSYNGTTDKTNTFIVASRIDWTPYFEYMLDCVMNGEAIVTDYTGTLKDGSVKVTALGAAAAEGTQAKLDDLAAKLNDGTLKVFDCSTFTVKGETLTSYLADVDSDAAFTPDTEVIATENGVTYFNESALRSAPYFDIIIDGITIIAD